MTSVDQETSNKSTSSHIKVQTSQQMSSNFIEIERFSSMNRLIRVKAYALRFVNNCKGNQKQSDCLSTTELNEAEITLIKQVQRQSFHQELNALQKNTREHSLIRKLRLFLKDGIIRCDGRIDNAEIESETKFPILLPSKHHFTKLIIEFTHSSFAHQGVNSTLVRLRSKYWVPKGRQVVRKLISRCVICRRLGGTPFKHPESPPLPSFRVKEKNPFEVTGVDFTGALYIKETIDTDDNKVYICLFTCAVTRNIHLELVRDLSAESFINCFRRFCSRKSLPS